MSDGNKFDITSFAQQRQQQSRLPSEEMGNLLLDAMQGTLVCLDSHHIIVDVSKAVKRYFGFDQTELIGLSVLLLIEDSERDSFLRFLNNPSQLNDMCCVRMMTNNPNEYRQVKIYRKKKVNQDNVDVHSTTPRHSYSVGTILLITVEESSYIDITLHEIHRQEFYTKMNLIGEIIFEDHRGALITGYLPHEILSQSIFNFVYHEDRLVKLHALWKCVTTGSSKLQWRLNSRDNTVVFLQTEYKLIADHLNHDTIIARNEVLSSLQKAQFDELQTAWRHQCTADIKGNSSSFKKTSSSDNDPSSMANGECRISVPSLNMCFTTNKLQPLNIQGNIFDIAKSTRPLTIQDYINILIDHDKYLDTELVHIINNIQMLTARYRRSVDLDKPQGDHSDLTTDEKFQFDSSSPTIDSSLSRKQDSDSIVRGILSNSIKYNHEKQTSDPTLTLDRLLNGNGNPRTSPTPYQSKTNSPSLSPEVLHQQHIDFFKKYKSAKAKLESQLELVRNQDSTNDIAKRNSILNKLTQLENIKNKHLARRHDLKRQTSSSSLSAATTTTAVPVNNTEQKDFLNSLFSSSSPNLLPLDNNNLFSTSNDQPFYPQQYQSGQISPSFEEFLTPPPSSYLPVQNTNSYMNVSYSNSTNDSSFPNQQQQQQHNTTFPY